MNALLLSPHNDDAELFATFLCLRHRPHVLVCLRSEKMAKPTYPGGMPVSGEIRERETELAMQVLGCSWDQMKWPDDWPAASIETALRGSLKAWAKQPEIVFAPAVEEGGHEQHNIVGSVAAELFGERVVHYLTYRNGRERSVGSEVPFEPDWPALKLAALSCYRSQIAHPMTAHHFIDHGLREYVQP